NNPLNFIYGNTELLAGYLTTLLTLVDELRALASADPALDKKARALLAKNDLEFLREDAAKLVLSVRVGAERAVEIVKGLRSFARMSPPDLTENDLAEMVNTALLLVSHELKGRVEVKRDLPALPPLVCDRSRMIQVLVNLL